MTLALALPLLRPALPAALCALACAAFANDRRFGYTYETATMAKGSRELEVWSTARLGRDDFYSRLDHRLEFETGITDNLQTAFYLNWGQITSADGAGGLATVYGWNGISSEWKYKLSDPVADPLGFALYGELGYNTNAIELEAKLLFDKQLGPILLAANAVGEAAYAAEGEGFDLEEWEFEFDLGAAYALKPSLSVGLELRNHNEIAKTAAGNMEFEHSALFLGPTVAYSAKSWWTTLTVLPQIPALHAPAGRVVALDEHEALETRLLFGLHL